MNKVPSFLCFVKSSSMALYCLASFGDSLTKGLLISPVPTQSLVKIYENIAVPSRIGFVRLSCQSAYLREQ